MFGFVHERYLQKGLLMIVMDLNIISDIVFSVNLITKNGSMKNLSYRSKCLLHKHQ